MPKRHHTVARFYLNRFATNERLELVSREDFGLVVPSTVERALAEKHFYSVDTDEGRDPLGETLITDHADTPGSVAIRRLFDDRRPLASPAWRGALTQFLAFQLVRGPRFRHALVEHTKAAARMMASIATPEMMIHYAQKRGEEMTEEEATDAIEFGKSGAYTIEVHRQANLHLSAALPAVPEVAPLLYERAWQVLEFPEPCLITSDEPVALVGPDRTAPGSAGGIKGADQVVFPIDPRHALVMVREELAVGEGWHPGDAEWARIINRHVAFSAHRWVVRSPGMNPLAGVTLPERAPPVFVVGNLLGLSPNISVTAQAKVIERGRRWAEKRRPR